jgi:hypothetical protein
VVVVSRSCPATRLPWARGRRSCGVTVGNVGFVSSNNVRLNQLPQAGILQATLKLTWSASPGSRSSLNRSWLPVSCGIQQQIPRKEIALRSAGSPSSTFAEPVEITRIALRSAGSLSSTFAEPKEALLPGDGNESINLCLVGQSPKYNLRNVERREVQCNVTVSGSIFVGKSWHWKLGSSAASVLLLDAWLPN